jgi:NAD(P)-dependent dehydrogenase (short-subunit alcohol dehydrogenase family)
MITHPRRRELVTGVSRRRGIGFAITRRLLADGASVFAQSWTAHDEAQPWGADRAGLAGMLEEVLADLGATVNTINPGPTDTGWADPELDDRVGRAMPRGRWNTPEEAAGVVALLLTADATNITGRVIDAEGGFRRWAD